MLNISIVNILLLSILLFVLGKFICEFIFRKKDNFGNMIKEQTVRTEGIIFLHSLGLLYVLIGMYLDNVNLSLGFRLAGLLLIIHTTYIYWNEMGIKYKVSILISGLVFVLYRILNTGSSIIEPTLTEKVMVLVNSFLS